MYGIQRLRKVSAFLLYAVTAIKAQFALKTGIWPAETCPHRSSCRSQLKSQTPVNAVHLHSNSNTAAPAQSLWSASRKLQTRLNQFAQQASKAERWFNWDVTWPEVLSDYETWTKPSVDLSFLQASELTKSICNSLQMFMQLQEEMISWAMGEFSRGRFPYDHQITTVGDVTGVNWSRNGISHSFYFCRCPEIFKTTTW